VKPAMKWTIVFLAFTILVTSCAHKAIEQSKEKYTPKYDTIGHQILRIEKENGDLSVQYRILDKILDLAKSKYEKEILPQQKVLSEKEYAKKTLKVIGNLLRNLRFSYGVENSELYRALQNSIKSTIQIGMDCKVHVYMYMAIASHLDLPIIPVITHRHILVAWKLTSKKYLFWESTSNSLTTEKQSRTFYWRYLDKMKILGLALNNKAQNIYDIADNNNKALILLNQAEKYYIGSLGLRLKSLIYYHRGEVDIALKEIDRALKVNPLNPWIHVTKVDYLIELKLYSEGRKHLSNALKIFVNHQIYTS
jgi:tetratricopeptide (TPR) repeat protein